MNMQIIFKDIVGQHQAIENLSEDLKHNKIAHAYLLEGLEGLGKKDIAMQFANALVCRDDKRRPCKNCKDCIRVSSGNHPNIGIIEDDNIIRVNKIRKLIDDIQLKPYEGNHKVYIMYDAHKMNVQSQNILLKTLEEPPPYTTLILLTTNANSLLPTIASRCQIIKLYPVSLEVIKNYLIQNKKVHEEKAHVLATFSGGAIGRAIELLNNTDFYYRREKVIEICNKLLTSNIIDILEQIEFFEQQRLHIEEIFDLIINWYRDLLLYNETKNMDLIANIDKREQIDFQARRVNAVKIRDVIFIIENAKNNLRSNVQFHLNIEVMLLNIQEVLNR